MFFWDALSTALPVGTICGAPKFVVTCSSGTNETDRIALLAFKSLITEDPLGMLNSWNQSTHLCEWNGVSCSRKHGRVTVLDLGAKRLTGTISPSLGNLSFLRSILFRDNHFQGNIPTELSNLFRLQNLDFFNNTLEGEIPTNLSSCRELKTLDMTFNNLVGKIPSSLGSLSKLEELLLYSNNLVGEIPSSLGNLTFLHALSLGTNSLTGTIPYSVTYFTKLVYFGIGLNRLSGEVPAPIYNITTLIQLVIPDNQLTGSVPSDIGLTLPNLRIISLGGNQFQGPFPESLSNASHMRLLDLSEGNFYGTVPRDLGRKMNNLYWLNLGSNNLDDTSFIDSLTNCSNFQLLVIELNSFKGPLPYSITNLSIQTTTISAGGNQLCGSIPSEIFNYENLVALGLELNNFSGSIPLEVAKLSNLRRLHMGRNKFSGTIPLSIGNLTRMFDLSLQENNFSGTVPSTISNIQVLETLNFSYNSFEGAIPKKLGLISVLSFIDLAHNSFSGPLPLEIGSLKNLEELVVSDNKLSGQIPSTLGSCLRLERLLLDGNMFQGGIPTSFSSLKGIQVLDLSLNNLSGQIPLVLQTLQSLKSLNLSFNNLTGEVPSLGVFKNISVISLEGNEGLCGGNPKLHLLACPSHNFVKKHHTRRTIIITVIIVTGFLLLGIVLVALSWRKKQKKSLPTVSSVGDDFRRISYDQLAKATDGFSPTSLIGAGTFGSVYKGVLSEDEKPIAVKVINLEQSGAAKSFIAECEILRRTRHRNLLKIVTVCSSVNHSGDDFRALVFEYMVNGSLESWLHPRAEELEQARNLELGQRLSIAVDIISALDYLHHGGETPIVHCDLKPSNVLIDENMSARVSDFGLSKFLAINTSNISTGQSNSLAIKGSIGYVAPEYGLGGQVSIEGDIYSFGILLLHMFTGKRPTDELFTDGLSLHEFCKNALPDLVQNVVDSRMVQASEDMTGDAHDEGLRMAKIRECLVSLIRIGVACSSESPYERMKTSVVLFELTRTKELFLGSGIHGRMQMPPHLLPE